MAPRILFRAGVAALLNASHPADYAFLTTEVIDMVNAALVKGSSTHARWRARMLALATELEDANNAGCPPEAPGRYGLMQSNPPATVRATACAAAAESASPLIEPRNAWICGSANP